MILLPNGTAVVLGGTGRLVNPTAAEVYNPATGTWSASGESHFTYGRLGTRAELLTDGRVLITGSFQEDVADFPFTELYDPVTGMWSGTGRFNIARGAHSLTRLNDGRVLAEIGRASCRG